MYYQDKFYIQELNYNDSIVPFVIKSIEEIENVAMGIVDEPHRHRYYSVIWPHEAAGMHNKFHNL